MDWKQQEKHNTQGILRFLWEEGFATAEQVKKHVFKENTDKSKVHRIKLVKMQKYGLIGRKDVLFSQSGVYYLTKTGWANLDIPEAHRISPTDKDKIAIATGPHRLKVIDARLEIERLMPMKDYHSERTLMIYPGTLPRKPDFLFTADGKPGPEEVPHRVAVEIELTYRNSKKTKQIIGYWAHSLHKNLIDWVLFLTDTNAKTQRLKGIIAGLKDQMVRIPLKATLLGEKTQREEKVLVSQQDIDRMKTATIGQIQRKETFN